MKSITLADCSLHYRTSCRACFTNKLKSNTGWCSGKIILRMPKNAPHPKQKTQVMRNASNANAFSSITQKRENRLLERVLKVLTNTSRVSLGHLPLLCNYAALATPTVSQWEWQVSDLWLQIWLQIKRQFNICWKIRTPTECKNFPDSQY